VGSSLHGKSHRPSLRREDIYACRRFSKNNGGKIPNLAQFLYIEDCCYYGLLLQKRIFFKNK
jgi:hypothetical protein